MNLIFLFISLFSIDINNNYALSANNNNNNRDRSGGGQSVGRACPPPFLKNGSYRVKNRGRFVRFQCNKSFILIGSQYAGCEAGRWDEPVPICARPGCDTMANPENGFTALTHKGAVITFFCHAKYKPAGVQAAYCDGTKWDRSLGTCRATQSSTPRWCDFEVDDICGWTHDDTHDFEWQRQTSLSDSAKRIRTGPQHDHTVNKSNEGHFMIIKSIRQTPDDKARLISPEYPAFITENGCFRFFHHMYGATVGNLRVYTKPVSIDLETVLEESKYLIYEISGNQKNVWKEALFDLNQYDEPFQIIIEGTAGLSHLSDIAIDDVALLTDEECLNIRYGEKLKETIESGGVFDIQTCTNRCNETESVASINDTIIITSGPGQGGFIKTCDCHIGCEDLDTCCPDFRSVCLFDLNEQDSDVMIETATTKLSEIATEITTIISIVMSSSTIKSTSSTIAPKQRDAFEVLVTNRSSTSTSSTISPNSRSIIMTDSTRVMEIIARTTKSNLSKRISPSHMWHNNMEDKKNVASTTNSENSDPMPTPIIIIVFSILLFVLCTIAIGYSIYYYRRNYGPENYKKNPENSSHNANEEFSEIRYLTSDEQIDFTMQMPAV